MLRYLYFICLLLLPGVVTLGTPRIAPARPKLVVHNDTAMISVRGFEKAALKNYSTQKEFQYGGGYVGESLWTKFWRWFWRLFSTEDKQTALGIFGIVLKYLFIALGIAALVFLILKLMGVNAFSAIKRKSQLTPLAYNELVEDIYAIDLDAEIEKAIGQPNYRLAVRLLYLRLLKQLSDAGLINWDITKTNSNYFNELTNAEQRIAFKMLTRQFEYVWYGDFAIDAQVFKKISSLFADFKIKAA